MLTHNLFGTGPLIGLHGRAIYDANFVHFSLFRFPYVDCAILSGSKAPGADLWHSCALLNYYYLVQ
jgi:hypothetical protein